jgi:hypothetical protein
LLVGLTLCVPDPDLPPLHAPLAVQELALVDDQVSVAESPEVMLEALASRETVGAAAPGGGSFTSLGSSSPEPQPAPSTAKAAMKIHAATPFFPAVFISPTSKLCWTEC